MKNKKILKVINDDSAVDLAVKYVLKDYDTIEMLSNECPQMRTYIEGLVIRGIINYRRILHNRLAAQIESKYIPERKDETVPF